MPAPFPSGNLHGAQRPVVAIPTALTRCAARWASSYLPGQDTGALVRALATLKMHPAQAQPGYSPAKAARQRVQLELNRRAAL